MSGHPNELTRELGTALVRGCGQAYALQNRRARHLPMRYETGSTKLGHPVQNVTREHGLTPLPR